MYAKFFSNKDFQLLRKAKSSFNVTKYVTTHLLLYKTFPQFLFNNDTKTHVLLLINNSIIGFGKQD